MKPAFNSASIAICLPGNASNVNLAATSETRLAPFVITMNWMMIRMRKTTSPTTRFPPTTKPPNVEMIFPAVPSSKIERVVPTFNDRRYSVISNSIDGKTDTSSGSLTPTVISSNRMLIAKLTANNMSSSTGGSGISTTPRTPSNDADNNNSLR